MSNEIKVLVRGCKGMFFIKQSRYDFLYNFPTMSYRHNIKVENAKDINNVPLL